MQYSEPIAKLTDNYMKLPGINQKTAMRLVFYTVGMKDEAANESAKSLLSVKRDLRSCSTCGDVTEEGPCEICRNPSRDRNVILVIEEPKNVMATEEIREYHGLYHVLHGVSSSIKGTGLEDISVSSPLQQLHNADVEKVIIITDVTTEGEATAMYLSRLIKPTSIKVTRLAYGLSVDSNIECADEVTLLKAVEGRREL